MPSRCSIASGSSVGSSSLNGQSPTGCRAHHEQPAAQRFSSHRFSATTDLLTVYDRERVGADFPTGDGGRHGPARQGARPRLADDGDLIGKWIAEMRRSQPVSLRPPARPPISKKAPRELPLCRPQTLVSACRGGRARDRARGALLEYESGRIRSAPAPSFARQKQKRPGGKLGPFRSRE
jgi:hypothetical protein